MPEDIFVIYYSCLNTPELQLLNSFFQVNVLKMVDEPMDEGQADSWLVSTQVNL